MCQLIVAGWYHVMEFKIQNLPFTYWSLTLITIGSGNGLALIQFQAIIKRNHMLLWIGRFWNTWF